MEKHEKIVDYHHHIVPKVYKDGLNKIGVTMSGGYPIKAWVPEDSLALMEQFNIETAVTSISEPATIPFKRKQAAKIARQVNEYQAQLKRAYPNRFKAFALVPMPHVKETIKEIKYALDVLKLDGIGLLSNYGEDFLGNDVFDPVMQVINERKALVFVHPSSSSKEFKKPQYVFADFIEGFTFNTTRAATNLILSGTVERYPDIKYILAHAGGTLPYLSWRINETLKTEKYLMKDPKKRLFPFIKGNKGDVVKTLVKHPLYYLHMFRTYKKALDGWNTLNHSADYYINRFYYDTALSTGDAVFSSLKEVTDVSHVVFGSDAHYAPDFWIDTMIKDIIRTKCLTEEEKKEIFSSKQSHLLS